MAQYLVRIEAKEFRHVQDVIRQLQNDAERVSGLSPVFNKQAKYLKVLRDAMGDAKPEE